MTGSTIRSSKQNIGTIYWRGKGAQGSREGNMNVNLVHPKYRDYFAEGGGGGEYARKFSASKLSDQTQCEIYFEYMTGLVGVPLLLRRMM